MLLPGTSALAVERKQLHSKQKGCPPPPRALGVLGDALQLGDKPTDLLLEALQVPLQEAGLPEQ